MDRSLDQEREKIQKKLNIPWQNIDELRQDVMDEDRRLMLKRFLVVEVGGTVTTFPRLCIEKLFSGFLIGRVYIDRPTK